MKQLGSVPGAKHEHFEVYGYNYKTDQLKPGSKFHETISSAYSLSGCVADPLILTTTSPGLELSLSYIIQNIINLLNCFIKDPNNVIAIIRIEGPHTGVVIALAVVGGGASILVPPSCVVQHLEVWDASEVWTGSWTLCCDKTKRKEMQNQGVLHCDCLTVPCLIHQMTFCFPLETK